MSTKWIKTDVKSTWNGPEVKVRAKRITGKSAFEIGLIVEAQAKQLCPRDTGRLVGSITTQAPNRGTTPQVPAGFLDMIQRPDPWDNDVLVGTAVFYGPFVEFGTRSSRAQPFLRPSLDMARGRALTIVRENGRFEFKEYLRG